MQKISLSKLYYQTTCAGWCITSTKRGRYYWQNSNDMTLHARDLSSCQYFVTKRVKIAPKLYIYFLSDRNPDTATGDTVTAAQAIAIIKACYNVGGKRDANTMQKYFARCESVGAYDTLCTE